MKAIINTIFILISVNIYANNKSHTNLSINNQVSNKSNFSFFFQKNLNLKEENIVNEPKEYMLYYSDKEKVQIESTTIGINYIERINKDFNYYLSGSVSKFKYINNNIFDEIYNFYLGKIDFNIQKYVTEKLSASIGLNIPYTVYTNRTKYRSYRRQFGYQLGIQYRLYKNILTELFYWKTSMRLSNYYGELTDDYVHWDSTSVKLIYEF